VTKETKIHLITHRLSQHLAATPVASRTFAASSAAKAEEILAKEERHPNGSMPVKVPKQAWRPKVQMACEEPEELPDMSGNLDWLFKEHGEAGIEAKKESPVRDDLTHCAPKVHATEIDDNIQWRGCPPEHRTALRAIVEKLFEVFAQEGMQNHTRGFEFNIDAGKVEPPCCRQPQHEPHKSRVIVAPVEKLERKGIVEDN
jgi:hypothetical protein